MMTGEMVETEDSGVAGCFTPLTGRLINGLSDSVLM